MSNSCPNLIIDGKLTQIDDFNISFSRSLYTYAGFIISGASKTTINNLNVDHLNWLNITAEKIIK